MKSLYFRLLECIELYQLMKHQRRRQTLESIDSYFMGQKPIIETSEYLLSLPTLEDVIYSCEVISR